MTTFDKREKGFEDKYEKEQEITFRANARRNKLLGLWAAELMGITDEDAQAYARQVVESDFEEAGDDDVLRKVLGDLNDKGLDYADHTVRKKMDELMIEAREQILQE